MRKIQTSSPFTFICVDTFKGKFIRTYKKSGLHGYKRYLPLKTIFNLLEKSNIKHPMFLRNRLTYVDIEFVEGKNLPEDFDRNIMAGIFCSTVFELSKINYKSVIKYVPYTNNRGFFSDNLKHFMIVMDKLNNYMTFERIGLRKDMIVSLANADIDNTRPMQFIHGDIHAGNIINQNNDYYIIDWEQATIGDLAYELAVHFVLTGYDESQRDVIYERVSQSLGINKQSLVNDVNVYIRFEITRKCFLKFNRAINLAKKGKPFDEILLDGYKYYQIICNKLYIDDIRGTLRSLYRG